MWRLAGRFLAGRRSLALWLRCRLLMLLWHWLLALWLLHRFLPLRQWVATLRLRLRHWPVRCRLLVLRLRIIGLLLKPVVVLRL